MFAELTLPPLDNAVQNLGKGAFYAKCVDSFNNPQKFVLYNLKEIANFGSLYTTRLYELIQEFKDTGYMIKSVERLRDIFAVGESFKRYNDFKRYTFDHACKEINNNHELNLGYEEIKEGRKVIAVKFVFKKTRIHKVTNQKTGIEKNFYIKPKQITQKETKQIATPKPDILEGQNSFKEIKKEPQPIQSIFSKVLNKFKSQAILFCYGFPLSADEYSCNEKFVYCARWEFKK